MLRRLTDYRLLIIVALALIVLRGIILPVSPPGFYVDEAATGAHVVAMLAHGTDAHGQSWPLFTSSLGGGYTTPVYLYPLTAWAAIFGTGELALRAFSQFMTIAAIIILACALRLWLGKKAGLIAAIVGLALPWGWLQGSLAWDPALVPFFVALSFLAFSLLLYTDSRKVRIASFCILPLSLLALAYVYPPCRVTAPLLFVGAYALLMLKKRISWRTIVLTCFGSAIVALPLLLFMIQPDALARSSEVSAFHGTTLLGGIWQVILNMAALLNPVFLFATGDANLRHATGLQGMLGLGALLPCLAVIAYLIRQKPRLTRQSLLQHRKQLLMLIAACGIMASVFSSALTSEGQPHSLRATAAWPFAVIVITIGWTLILRSSRRWITYVAAGIFAVSVIFYAADLAYFYPARAADSFDTTIVEQLHHHQLPSDYPPLSLQYYQQR